MAFLNVAIKTACTISILLNLILAVPTTGEERGISQISKRFIRHVLSCLNKSPDVVHFMSPVVLSYDSFTFGRTDNPIGGVFYLEPQGLLVEDLIIWDPMLLFPRLPLNCPTCSTSERLKATTRWKDGEKQHDLPRKIYGLKNDVLVVSRVYSCRYGHQIIAHDPDILSQLKGLLTPGFILFHKGGITIELYDFINTHMQTGLSTSEIQVLWYQTLFTAYVRKREIYQERIRMHFAISGDNNNLKQSVTFPPFNHKHNRPGAKIITACIIKDYFENEILYSRRMCQMTARKWLSCDHTFKVAANVGFWWNKSWIKVYDTLFLIMNENGVVLTWQLCKGTAFDAVEHLVQELKERLDSHQETVQFIFLDNCCHWSKKLQHIFPSVQVKLDSFHAIQRIVKKIPKRGKKESVLKQMRQNMRNDLRLIIRSPEDRGRVRTMDTPSPEIIIKNIDMFMKQWSCVKVDNVLVLPVAAVKKIENLRKHIVKGCLSNIPPSGGTHRNEVLHKTLNKSIANSRIGIQLAVALLGTFFYRWNEQRLSKECSEKKMPVIKPIGFYGDVNDNNRDGTFHNFGTEPGNSLHDFNNLALETTDNTTLKKFADTLTTTINLPENESSSGETDSSYDSEGDESTKKSGVPVLKKDSIEKIIQQTSDMVGIYNNLHEAQPESLFNPHHGIYFKNALHLLHQSRNSSDQLLHLNSVLSTHGLKKISVPADGNCFFTSIAVSIQQQILNNTVTPAAIEHLENLGLLKLPIPEMSATLRTLVVQEWLLHPEEYSPFVLNDETTFTEQANAFLQDGHFSSSLGDCMPLATANLLAIPIIIYSGMEYLPAVPLIPQGRTLSTESLKLAYDPSFCGHYDAVTIVQSKDAADLHVSADTGSTTPENSVTCRCGQGAKKKKKTFLSCHEFKSGCPCFQKACGCSDSCNCLNCNNPFGKRSPLTNTPEATGTRKRRKHEMSTKNSSGKVYWDKTGGNPGINHWTLFEELILLHILNLFSSKVVLTPDDIFIEFNEVVKIVQKTEFSKHLTSKTLQQILQKVSTLQKSKRVFDTLVEEQEKLNLQ